MNNFINVQGKPDLQRDEHSKGISNKNTSAYDNAVRRSKEAQAQRDELRSATREINNIKSEMHEIKSLLQQLVGT